MLNDDHFIRCVFVSVCVCVDPCLRIRSRMYVYEHGYTSLYLWVCSLSVYAHKQGAV